jgi:hypothetical protein
MLVEKENFLIACKDRKFSSFVYKISSWLQPITVSFVLRIIF